MQKYKKISFLSLVLIGAILLSANFKTDKFGPNLKAKIESNKYQTYPVYVFFEDKGNNITNYLNNPLLLVSQKSLDRRAKVLSLNSLVDFTDIPLNREYVNQVSSRVNKVRYELKWLNCVTAECSLEQLKQLEELNFVKRLESIETYTSKKESIENVYQKTISDYYTDSPLVDSLNYGTGSALTQITQIKVNVVHNNGIFGQGVLIANFDAGFSNLTHEVFTTYPMKIKRKRDFHTGDTVNLTGHSHGTATLSLVGGYKPGKLIGPAFASDFILCRTEVDPTETPIEMDHWIAAAQWADSLGVDVITSSLSYLDFDLPYTSYTWQDMNGNTMPITIAADLAVKKGIVVNNSAGNNGLNSSHNTLGGPADGDSVITVGAVTSTGIRSSFSSVGPTTDNPPRIKPDLMAMGSNNYVATTLGNSYSNGSGTSYSCPITAGVVALMLSANKNLTPIQIRGILRKFASNSNSPDNLMGWGIIDAEKSVDSARKMDNVPPIITHTQPFTTTTNTGTITLKARMYDNGIIRHTRTNEAPRIYYRKNTGSGWTSFMSSNYTNLNIDTFYFQIPGSALGTQVEYYFACQDIALMTPLVSTLPTGGSGINPPGTTAPGSKFIYSVGNFSSVTGNENLPTEFKLFENYPNPFNPSTIISFQIPKAAYVKLEVYDVNGRVIRTLISSNLNPGVYNFEFSSEGLSSGIYFYRLQSDSFTGQKKMILVK